MIAGIGSDIVEIARIAAAYARQGDRFAARVLGDEELAEFHRRRARSAARGDAFLATRFAAKEAYAKAIGLGMRPPMAWRAVQILNDPVGRPIPVPSGALAAYLTERGWQASVTLSDERLYAIAFVAIERK